MYQNMSVPVISGDFITNESICTVAEKRNDGESFNPVYIDSLTDTIKYGMMINYGNYLYIENKPDSGYNINVAFEEPTKIVKIINQGKNYSIKIVCKTFLQITNATTLEAVFTTL